MDSETFEQYSKKSKPAPSPPRLSCKKVACKPVPCTAAAVVKKTSAKKTSARKATTKKTSKKKTSVTQRGGGYEGGSPMRFKDFSTKMQQQLANVEKQLDLMRKTQLAQDVRTQHSLRDVNAKLRKLESRLPNGTIQKLSGNYSKVGRNQLKLIENDRCRNKRVKELEEQIRTLQKALSECIQDADTTVASDTDSSPDDRSSSSSELQTATSRTALSSSA